VRVEKIGALQLSGTGKRDELWFHLIHECSLDAESANFLLHNFSTTIACVDCFRCPCRTRRPAVPLKRFVARRAPAKLPQSPDEIVAGRAKV
jgi:hypothetical protein